MSNDELHLSPSEYHHHLLRNMEQKLAYDGGPVDAWQAQLRARVLECMGLDLDVERVPLQVRSLWVREHELGTIEKLVFTAEPYADVPAFLCLPKEVSPPYRCFICLQGHSSGMHNSIAVERDDNTEPIEVPGDRDFGIGCMRRGVAALCLEQRSFGERRELKLPHEDHIPLCHNAAAHALILGRTLVGERVFDIDRGIDYLASRGDIQMDQVGVMGNSGGGTASLFAAAALPRLAAAMPSCYFCTFADSIMKIYHCIDNYIPGILQWAEMADVMGLFAPRPLVIVAGREDGIFPIDGARRAFAKLQEIYTAAGAADRCKLVVGDGGHRFYADDAWPVMLDLLEGESCNDRSMH